MTIPSVKWPSFAEWRAVVVRTWNEASDDNVSFLAAAVAFYAFLAFVPLLASVVLTYGLAAAPRTVAEHIRTLSAILPSDAASLIGEQLRSMTETPKSAKGWSLLLAFALALYGASKGSGAVLTALNIAYEVKETRGFFHTTLISLAMTVGGLIVLLVAAAAISVMGWMEALLPGLAGWMHSLLQLLFWAIAFAVAGTGISLVYRYAPDRPEAPWAWITPGSAAATLLWLAATVGFGLYVTHFGNYNATYGSLGGVIVFLTWLYLSAYVILIGGELNSELEREVTGRTAPGSVGTTGLDQPGKAGAEPAPPVSASPPAPGPFGPQAKAEDRGPRHYAAMLVATGALGFLWGRRRGRKAERKTSA